MIECMGALCCVYLWCVQTVEEEEGSGGKAEKKRKRAPVQTTRKTRSRGAQRDPSPPPLSAEEEDNTEVDRIAGVLGYPNPLWPSEAFG